MISDLLETTALIWLLSAAIVVIGIAYCIANDKDDEGRL